MRVAIFGGSFNPPHLGHLKSALAAAQQLKPDHFIVIPDHQPPHKVLEVGSPTPAERLELCRLSFAEVEKKIMEDMK